MIKVITGVRRYGKSCLMHTIAEEIIESGVSENNIVFIVSIKRGFRNIKTQEALEKIDELCNFKGIKISIY